MNMFLLCKCLLPHLSAVRFGASDVDNELFVIFHFPFFRFDNYSAPMVVDGIQVSLGENPIGLCHIA